MSKQQSEKFKNQCELLGLKQTALNYQQHIDRASKENKGYLDFLQQIVEQEFIHKKERSIAYRIESSKLPVPRKYLKDYDFSFQPQLNPRLVKDLFNFEFMQSGQSVLFIGSCGTGKSHLAQSLGLEACKSQYKVLYTTCSNLLIDLNRGVYEKTLNQRLTKYLNPQLLIIDEMGHDRLELEVTKEAHLLFKVIDQRYQFNKSLIFTTNVEETDWAEYLGDPISTKAILDRIFHRSIVVKIKGSSYRRYESDKLQEKYETQSNPEK